MKHVKIEQNLKSLFENKRLSLTQISKKANINKSTLHGYLNGIHPMGLNSMIKLCQLFDISLDELVFGPQSQNAWGTQGEPVLEEGQYEITIRKIKKP